MVYIVMCSFYQEESIDRMFKIKESAEEYTDENNLKYGGGWRVMEYEVE